MTRLVAVFETRQDVIWSLLIGIVTGWIFTTAPGWLQASDHKHWWDIATAVGTVGTVIVALALASRDSVRRRAEKMLKAKLVAIGMNGRLAKIRFDMKRLARDTDDDPHILDSADTRAPIRQQLERAISSVSFEEVEALAIAPGEVAENLMRAYDLIKTAIATLEIDGTWDDENLQTFRQRLTGAREHVGKAQMACKKNAVWR